MEAHHPHYRPQLDGVRGVAMVAVAMAHWAPEVQAVGLPLGWMAVMTFYVLSGYLITGILLRGRGQPLKDVIWRFYVRRFLRIFPMYYGILVIGMVLGISAITDSIFWHATYLTNLWLFANQGWHGCVSHFWTLSVEEQFYVFWPWLILLHPNPRRAMPWVIASAPTFRVIYYLLFPDTVMAGLIPISCLDALGLGGWLACAERDGVKSIDRVVRIGLWVGAPAWIILTWLDLNTDLPSAFVKLQTTGLSFTAAWIVWRASRGFSGPVGRFLSWRPIRFIGKISYGLYLLHLFAPIAVHWVLPVGTPSWKTVPLLATITLSWATFAWFFFEKPINDLKAYVPYSGAKSAPQAD